jgi:hypothetical protein
MPYALPAIDASTCSQWTEQDINLYNKYSFYLAKTQVERRSKWMTFQKLVKGKKKWTPNMGPIMRGVRTNMSPHLRQQVTPRPLTAQPKADYNNITETTTDAILFWQEFESPSMYFLPSFQDFLDHISDVGEDMMEKVERFEELFYRTMMFHMSPFLFVACGNTVELVNITPYNGLTELDITTMGKTTNIMKAQIEAYMGKMSHLTLASLASAHTKMSVNLGVPFFKGSDVASGDSKPLEGKYLLITGEEAWDQFTFDPYVAANKNCSLDIVHDQYRGDLFGRIVGRLESLPMHFQAGGTQVAPEIRVDDNALTLNEAETIPNPSYANINDPIANDPTACSPYAISWLAGSIGYDALEVGPPPAAFTSNKMPHNFPADAMEW